jgi:hypothetical protein
MSNDSHDARCSHCGGGDFVVGVRVGQSAAAMRIGLKFRDGLLLVGTEPIVADLCTTCGTVQRLYVENTKHHWLMQ